MLCWCLLILVGFFLVTSSIVRIPVWTEIYLGVLVRLQFIQRIAETVQVYVVIMIYVSEGVSRAKHPTGDNICRQVVHVQ